MNSFFHFCKSFICYEVVCFDALVLKVSTCYNFLIILILIKSANLQLFFKNQSPNSLFLILYKLHPLIVELLYLLIKQKTKLFIMDKAVSSTKSGLQFGVLFGVIMIFEFVISYILDIDPSTNKSFGIVVNFLNFLILPVLFIYLGCDNYKNKLNSGFITFGECLKIGVSICVIAALLYALFSAVFGLIFPEFMEDVLRKTRNVMLEQNPNMPEEQVEMALSWTKKIMSPAIGIPVTIVMYAFLGLIYSLIIGAVTKKENPQSI